MNDTARGLTSQDDVTLETGKSVSFQVFQDIYNEITGKKERLSKVIRLNHVTSRDDIDQLHYKILQNLEQYNVKSSNCSVTLYFTDDNKEVFSSYDRFKIYDQTKMCSTENVHIEYNFLILLPQARNARPYKISIDIHSASAIRQKIKENIIHGRVYISFPPSTGRFDIEYVDYSVAKSFHTIIDHWFDSLECIGTSKFVKYLQSVSHYFPTIFKYTTAIIVSGYVYFRSVAVSDIVDSLSDLAQFGILAFSLVFVASGISFMLGRIAESAIDGAQPISYLKLTKGDASAYQASLKENRSAWRQSILAAGSSLLLNLVAVYIASKMGV